MLPVVTVSQMRAIDANASVAESELIERAGWAVATRAKAMMGGRYGRRVLVVAGPGNNGADGKVAARLLRRWGSRVTLVTPSDAPPPHEFDLVVDAAFGTGFRGGCEAQHPQGVPVLAVDVPSGLDGDTGEASDGVATADQTITFAAYKPGHFLGSGPELCGEVHLADIGLDVSGAGIWVVDDSDIATKIRKRSTDSHKWKSAVTIIAGSPGMTGAATLAASGAQRAGAGAVRLASPGQDEISAPPPEIMTTPLPSQEWVHAALAACERASAVVIGPGLGRSVETVAAVKDFVRQLELPLICDADALFALCDEEGQGILRSRSAPAVLTPHDKEFERFGVDPGPDRISAVRELARETSSIVLLKGSTTTVADPEGTVLLSVSGSAKLATAGTGDVLSGIVGTLLAMDVEPLWAGALAAHVHGRAADRGLAEGLIAGDLPALVAEVLTESSVQSLRG